MVDEVEEPFGVVAGIDQELGLLGRERADSFLQQDVDGEADGRERRLQLVAHRGDQVGLELVEEAEARDVVEDDGRAEGVAVGVADGPDLR